MGKMKELMADEWDRAYSEGYRKGYLTAMRWAFGTLQTEQQTEEMQGTENLIELIDLGGGQP
jgi:hypothetical protein